MQTKPIKTKKEYHKALKQFEKVFQAKVGTKESDEADTLSLLIQNYENKHFIFTTLTKTQVEAGRSNAYDYYL